MDLWESTDLPLLQLLGDRERESPRAFPVESTDLSPQLDRDEVWASLRRLRDYVEVQEFGHHVYLVKGLTERGLRRSGVWPSEDAAYEALMNSLAEAVEEAEDPEERSRLERLREAAAGVGREVITRLAVTLLTNAAS